MRASGTDRTFCTKRYLLDSQQAGQRKYSPLTAKCRECHNPPRQSKSLLRCGGETMGGKRVVQVVALTGLMTLVAGWLAAAPAGAATPTVDHIKVNVSLPG